MSLIEDLQKTKDRFLLAVSQIDALMKSLGAIGDVDSDSFRTSVVASPNSGPSSEPVVIPYMDEAKAFVANWSKHKSFRISDFAKFLASKYGKENVNDQSMRGPFPRLVESNLIYVCRKGIGKMPNIYRIVSDLPRVRMITRLEQPPDGDRPDDDRLEVEDPEFA